MTRRPKRVEGAVDNLWMTHDGNPHMSRIRKVSAASRNRDTNTLAHAIVKEATGQAKSAKQQVKDAAAVERGRAGGLARAERTSPEERSEDARRAVQARWEKAKRSRKAARTTK